MAVQNGGSARGYPQASHRDRPVMAQRAIGPTLFLCRAALGIVRPDLPLRALGQ